MAKDQLEFRLTVRDDGTIAVERFVSSVQRGGKRVKQSAGIMGRAFGRVNRSLITGFKAVGNRINALPRSILNVRNALIGLGAVLVVRNIINAFVDFQRVMNRVGAITGAVGEEFAALEATARKLGETTVFSAVEAGQAMDLLARAGLDANEVITATAKVLDIAAAGQLELADATRIVLGVVKGLGIELEDLTEANDILVKTFISANVTLIDLGESLKFVGPIAKASGQDLTTLAALLGKLGDAGIRGSLAGTSLRRSLAALINPTKEAAKVLKLLEITVTDGQGQMRNFIDILDDLEKAGITNQQVFKIFGQRAATAILALKEGVPGIRELKKALDDAGGTAKRVAERQLKGLVGALVRMKSAIEGAKISIGEELAPTIEKIAEGITDFARDVSAATVGVRAFNEELGRTSETPFADTVTAFLPSLQGLVDTIFFVRKGFLLLQIGITKVSKFILQAFLVINKGIRFIGTGIDRFERDITVVFLTLANFVSKTTGDLLEDIITLVRGIAKLLAKVPFGDELADPLLAGADAAEIFQKALSKGIDVQAEVAKVTARQKKGLGELDDLIDEIIETIELETATIKGLDKELANVIAQQTKFNTALEKGRQAAADARKEQAALLKLRREEAVFGAQIIEQTVTMEGLITSTRKEQAALLEVREQEARAAAFVAEFGVPTPRPGVVRGAALADLLFPPETPEQLFTRTRELLDELLPMTRDRIIAEEAFIAEQVNLTRDKLLNRLRERAIESIAIERQRAAESIANAKKEAKAKQQLENFKSFLAQKSLQLVQLAEEQGFISAKASAIGQAVINTALAITKATAQFGAFAGPAIAIIAALGAAQIAIIASSKPGGRGGGGGGGGSLGGAAAAPGAAPAEEAVAPAAAGQQVNITVQGFIGNEAELASQIGRVFREAVGDSVDFGVEVQT